MPTINARRLLEDLNTLRDFGRHGNGVVRPSLSPLDLQAREWLRERMHAAGVDAHIDGVGNVIGRSPNPGKAVLIGSHSDTQPTGGWLDGALGVIYGLEVVRALAEDEATKHLAVDPVSWIDEEGTFLGCLGSRAYCGLLADDEIDGAQNAQGVKLRDALAAAGLNGEAAGPEKDRYAAYVEAHIEQGAYLENDNKKIGVVTGIVGSRNFFIRFAGQQNHAGTTPMAIRKDAGQALISFAYQINKRFETITGPRTVWTMGDISLHPGAPSVIPGRAELRLQFRDPDLTRLETFEAQVHELAAKMNAAGPVKVSVDAAGRPSNPAIMDDTLQKHIATAAETHAAGCWQHMPSAAIHDAMYLAEIMPAAMLFIPSIGGISHDFAEDTSDEDIVLGCQVMASAVASILSNQ